MDTPHHVTDIPIWVNDTRHYVTGLTRRTTCDDVIYALLHSAVDAGGGGDLANKYAILEKWRGVERPLSVSSSSDARPWYTYYSMRHKYEVTIIGPILDDR